MKRSISQSDFIDAFRDCGRENQFTYDGLCALYDWLEELDNDCGTETELDVIALCCEFTEYENLDEFQDNYGADDYPDIEAINDYTIVIPVTDERFIIQDF